MNQEPFHVLGQEWRYRSQNKALLHTLHLAQLPSNMTSEGDAIPVEQVPPTNGRFNGAGVPPLQLPAAPSLHATIFNTYNQFIYSDIYGCVGTDQTILAQKNCAISIDSWTSALMQVTMNPNKSGYYLIHLECQTDLRTLGYQGPDGNGACQGSAIVDGGAGSTCNMQVKMNGATWDASIYVDSIGHSSTTFIKRVLGEVVFQGTNLGDPTAVIPAHISCFIMKINAP